MFQKVVFSHFLHYSGKIPCWLTGSCFSSHNYLNELGFGVF